ncbi:nuclear transport factor 2 family protein [Nocardioides sp. KIGAM211]|uniref:Nuclear transport factor 2 family protein n=2 Tax=Nocardioides luti TaxID=2761101 RepID=A0A7X0RD77_9ACTN|nr:nuclear transport factor 2 family protein [Nocardioides luti]
MDAFWQGWLAANREAERRNDWRVLADSYAEDATYGWMYTPDEHFMAVGREQIRDWALGTEMAGLDGWHYDYVATVMDESNGMVIGFWRQRAGIADDSGKEYEILGIGGSWFGLVAGPDGLEIGWQRDWFDLGSTATTFLALAGSGRAPQGLLDRMGLDGMTQPGHYRLADLPSTVWPPPVDAGEHAAKGERP